MKIAHKIIALSVLFSAAFAANSWAGFKANGQVTIYPTTRIVDGVLGSARNSADSTQYIGCKAYVPYLGAKPEGLCLARDANGVTATCYTDHPDHVALIRSVKHDSAIRFIYSEGGGCTYLSVENISYYEPKVP